MDTSNPDLTSLVQSLIFLDEMKMVIIHSELTTGVNAA